MTETKYSLLTGDLIKGYSMIKKLWIIGFLSSLFFIGCSKTAPNLNGNNIANVDSINEDAVNIDETTYGNEQYNSSSDGFHSVYFNFNEYAIASNMESVMQTNIARAKSTDKKIKIEGNCDEFGTDEYNYALGLKRAKSVKENMIAQGISPSQMVIVSFGESNPVCTKASNSCYDRNRRVDIRLIK
jgi:peptidoglycan-associated lipoprotein